MQMGFHNNAHIDHDYVDQLDDLNFNGEVVMALPAVGNEDENVPDEGQISIQLSGVYSVSSMMPLFSYQILICQSKRKKINIQVRDPASPRSHSC